MNFISYFIEGNITLSTMINFAGSPALLSVLGTYLLFNIKEAGEKGLNQGTSCVLTSAINFAAPLRVVTMSESQDKMGESEIFVLEGIC